MNVETYLVLLARHFAEMQLDAVMIGNAAASIRGATVTTLDVDFMIEHTDENYRKLAALAQRMDCLFVEIKLPGDNYMYRVAQRVDLPSLDFLFVAAGITNFENLKKNSTDVFFGENILKIASLEDILASKRAAGRPKDLAVIPILEMTLDEQRKQ